MPKGLSDCNNRWRLANYRGKLFQCIGAAIVNVLLLTKVLVVGHMIQRGSVDDLNLLTGVYINSNRYLVILEPNDEEFC